MNNGIINDIASTIGSGITPLRSNSKYWDIACYPWLKTEQLGEFQIFDTSEYISQVALDKTSIKLWPPKTISVAMYGEGQTRGNVSILMREMATNQACCNIVVDESKADYRYIYYWLKNSYHQLRILASGVRKNLNSDDIKTFPIKYPDLQAQKNIGDVLFCIDKKIALNKCINTELEAMAKTLYDYWFVQFDFPDENGKPYRTSGGAMELNDQLKREIPKGWKVGQLCDIANIVMGQSPSGDSYNEQGFGMVFYQGSTDFGTDYPLTRVYTTAPSRIAQQGDILLSVRAPVGAMNTAFEKCCVGRGLAAINSKIGTYTYLYCLVTGLKKRFDVLNGNGTTFGSLTKDTLFEIEIVIPPDNLVKLFETTLPNYDEMRLNSEKQTRELTRLRDWLLPLLMNGQSTVESEDI